MSHILDELTSNISGVKTAFCGEPISHEFHFTGASHAVAAMQAETLAVPCLKCRKAIIQILKKRL